MPPKKPGKTNDKVEESPESLLKLKIGEIPFGLP